MSSKQLSKQLKRWLHIIGGGLGLAGIIFVIFRLQTHFGEIDLSQFHLSDWTALTLLALIYGVANVFLAFAWRHLLFFFDTAVNVSWTIRVYGISQLAKYVPGNIFHLAGRQALGMAAGLKVKPLALSAIWELGLITLSGALFGLLVLPLVFSNLSGLVAFGLFGGLFCLIYIILNYGFSKNLAKALFWQVLFLAISGAVFTAILFLVASDSSALPSAALISGAFVLAWLAGLITPGAPAGIGIREATILFLLSNLVAPVDLLLAVLLGRVVTVFGDLFFFMASSISFTNKTYECN